MALEMRLDGDVFLMGEEVAQYQGAYKISQGLLDEFGEKRVVDMPITEHGFTGMAVGAAMNGLEADRRVHDVQLRHAGDRPDHQFGRQDALHVGRPDGLPHRVPRARTAPRRASPPSTARITPAGTRIAPGLKVVAPYSSADAKGLLRAAIRDPNPVIFLENEILYGQTFPCPEDEDFILPIGRARIEREGTHVTIVAYSIMVGVALNAAEIAARPGHRGGSRQFALAASAGHRHRRGEREKD